MNERKDRKTQRNRPSLRLSVFAFLLGAFLPPLLAQETARPKFIQQNRRWIVQVHLPNGLTDSLPPEFLLPVFVGEQPTSSNQSSILGSYTWENAQLRFSPTFPFRAGQSYRAKYLDGPWTVFQIPRTDSPNPPRLLHVYPTVDSLPANLLKMYLHFSEPMRQGVAYENLTVWDNKGEEIRMPFLQLQPELWDVSGTILTLWLDPGRVKRALGPNEAWGPPLQVGETYTIRINNTWTNLKGEELAEKREKNFVVHTDDRVKPEITHWTIQQPNSGTLEPLSLSFEESMDWQLGNKVFQIVNQEGQLIEGKGSMQQMETVWQFYPNSPWQIGMYSIQVESRFEDLAGNNLNRLFDRDLEKEKERPSEAKIYSLEFRIE